MGGLGTVIVLGFCMNRPKPPVVFPAETATESAPAETFENQIARTPDRPQPPEFRIARAGAAAFRAADRQRGPSAQRPFRVMSSRRGEDKGGSSCR